MNDDHNDPLAQQLRAEARAFKPSLSPSFQADLKRALSEPAAPIAGPGFGRPWLLRMAAAALVALAVGGWWLASRNVSPSAAPTVVVEPEVSVPNLPELPPEPAIAERSALAGSWDVWALYGDELRAMRQDGQQFADQVAQWVPAAPTE